MDHNSGSLMGYAYGTFTQSPDGVRSTAESSFLAKAFEATSLTAYIQTQVTKILFDADKKATGVQVSTQGLPYTLSARKEVILSAGAVSRLFLDKPMVQAFMTSRSSRHTC